MQQLPVGAGFPSYILLSTDGKERNCDMVIFLKPMIYNKKDDIKETWVVKQEEKMLYSH